MRRQALVPDSPTYAVLTSACAQARQPQRTLEINEEMQQRAIVPDGLTFNRLGDCPAMLHGEMVPSGPATEDEEESFEEEEEE